MSPPQPLSIVYGWDLVRDFIQGAHDMDKHFVETNPRHNLPVLLALTDVWNDTLLGASARVVHPFTEAFAAYPHFVAVLESQTCSRRMDRAAGGSSGSSIVLDAGLDGALDRALYQSSSCMNTEIVMAMDTQVSFNTSRIFGSSDMEDIQSVQDSLMCSVFAHADELAFGYHQTGQSEPGGSPASSPGPNPSLHTGETTEGNRPSLLLMTGKLDAFACGQLIALAEHRAVVKAHMYGLDPFVQEVGSALRMYRTDLVKEEFHELYMFGNEDADEEDDGEARLNLSSRTLLRHYAALVRNQRAKPV